MMNSTEMGKLNRHQLGDLRQETWWRTWRASPRYFWEFETLPGTAPLVDEVRSLAAEVAKRCSAQFGSSHPRVWGYEGLNPHQIVFKQQQICPDIVGHLNLVAMSDFVSNVVEWFVRLLDMIADIESVNATTGQVAALAVILVASTPGYGQEERMGVLHEQLSVGSCAANPKFAEAVIDACAEWLYG